MADALLDTADALVVALNGHDWGEAAPDFTAVRSFRPIVTLAEETAGDTAVRVVPVSDGLSGKAVSQADVVLRIFVQQKLPAASTTYDEAAEDATLAVLYAFTAAMQLWMLANALSVDGVSAWCVSAGRDPAHDMELLHNAREYLCCILATYRLIGL